MLNPLRNPTFRSAALSACGATLLAACAALPPDGSDEHGTRAPLGSLTIAGPTFGQRELVPTACSSGEPQFFLGFDLQDKSAGMVTRLVVDPATGPIVRVFAASAPFNKATLFRDADCRVFHFSLDTTGWRINRVQQLDISLDLDCQLPSGDRIVGKASDRGCL